MELTFPIGVEFPAFPKCLEAQGGDEEDERLVVADMSSNFLSRKVDISKYSVIFVGDSTNNRSVLLIASAGRRAKERWSDRYYNRHHQKITASTSDYHAASSIAAQT